MAKSWAKPLYNSKPWQDCRQAYIQSVNGLCETCLEDDIIKPGKILHHIDPLTPENINNPEVTLNWDNLKFECKECHDKHEGHGVGKKVEVTREGLIFNEDGELVKV